MHLVNIVTVENTMDNWDDNPADPVILKTITAKNKWEGEDAEEDIKDSWDQDPDEEKSDDEVKPAPPPSKKSTKKIGEKFEEKKKKLEAEKPPKPLTNEEILAEKIRAKLAQEESDRILAKEMCGSTSALETKEDFDKFRTDIMNVISESTKNSNYVAFAEQLIQSLCIHLSSVDLKKINTTISNLHIEKSKMEKGEKSKKNKGKGKAKLKLEGDNDYSEYSAFTEDFDDFI